jgi:hypothetical protein
LAIAQPCIANHAMSRQGALSVRARSGLILQVRKSVAGAIHSK